MTPPQEAIGFTLEQSAIRSKYGVTVVGVKSPGQDFTYEPAARHAEARRIMQLEAQTAAATRPGSEEGNVDFTQSSSGAPSADAIAGRLGNQPSGAHADSNPLNEIISENTRAQRSTGRTAEPLADAPKPATSSEAAGAKEPKDVSFDTGSFQAVRWDSGGDSNIKRQGSRQSGSGNAAHSGARGSHRKPEADTASEPASDAVTQNIPQQTTGKDAREEYKGSGHHVAAEQKQSASRRQQQTRGRRRSDEQRDGSVSVSELLAQMKKDK